MSTASQPVDQFLTDCKESQTNFTRRMNALFEQPWTLPSLYPDVIAELRIADGLDKLSDKIKAVLSGAEAEFVNIDKWSNALKEQVRKKLVEAIDDPVKRSVRFSWELYHGDTDNVVIQTTAEQFSIKFLSPWKNVSYDGRGNVIQYV